MPTPIAEDLVTLAGLREFLAGCDVRYPRNSDIKSYGLSINDHTVSLVEGGQNNSVTIPDSDTTYTTMSKVEAEGGTSTDARVVTGERIRQAIGSFLHTATWADIENYGETTVHI